MSQQSSEMRILTTARCLFFEHGFEGVSTDMLAREAAVSKATIYRYFDNMTDVLRRVTEVEMAQFSDPVPPMIKTREELQQVLTHYGIRLMSFLNKPDTVKFARLIHEEARANPDMARAFFIAAHDATQRHLAQILTDAQARAIVAMTAAPMEVAEDLMGLFEGLGMARVQLGVCDVPYNDVERRADRAVQTILKMHT